MYYALWLLLFIPLPCYSLYPNLLWKTNLLQNRNILNGGLRKGNAVVLSKDQNNLWVADAAGSLHVVRLIHGNRDHVLFEPSSLPNRAIESRSSVALYEGSQTTFAAYTVIDTPDSDSESIASRVICVDENNSLLWITSLNGSAVGSPQISSDGKHIIVLHNLPEDGVASILSVQEDGNILSQKPGNFFSPFGPPKLVTVNNVDFVYWGESTGNGYGDVGRILHLKVEEPFNVVADFLFDSSTVVQPTISADGSTMWLGGREASLYSWKLTGDRGRVWTQQLALSRRNVTFPIVNQIEASGSKLFIASATNSFHCLSADDGKMLWSASFGPSIYLSSAKYSPRENVVYSIQHLTGKVVQQHAGTGDVLWHFDCVNITGSPICMDSVEAESSLSQDGSTLYYGDIYGTVYALAVSKVPDTDAPSYQPSSHLSATPSSSPSSISSKEPSPAPSLAPSKTASEAPSSIPSSMPSKQTMLPSASALEEDTGPKTRAKSSGVATFGISFISILIAVLLV